jgi:FkbM family methyltransferase
MEAVLSLARRLRTSVGGERVWDIVRPLYWRTVSALAGDRGMFLALPDGHSYRIDPQFYAWHVDQYEPAVVRELTRTLGPSSIVYDVGAHVGLMTVIAARRVEAGCVYAFEPSPPNCRLLERHVRINGFADRVRVSRVLVGDEELDAVPFVHRPGQFTANSLAYSVDGGETTPTRMITIDRVIARSESRPPTHLKIDVEGYEGAVLRGARETLRRYHPLVICALHPEPLALLGETTADIVRFMDELGYSAFHLDGKPAAAPGFEEIVFRATSES